VKDYENIITRLRKLPAYIDQTIDLMREQLAAGLAQPVVVVDLMLDQIVTQSRASVEESPLLIAFRRLPRGHQREPNRRDCVPPRAPRTNASS
jgi:uncharacterized protein (DUF885 family)